MRAGVREDFPEIAWIADPELQRLVTEAWSHSLCCSGFTRITEMPPEGNPGAPVLRRGTQADHLRGVVRLAVRMADEIASSWPETRIDRDILVAGAVCHDVGKPFEFDPDNRARWAADPSVTGQPTFRHSVFGMHVCLTVGLPDEVAHVALAHSMEGQFIGVSAECMIVRQADNAWWFLAGAAGLLTPESTAALSPLLRSRTVVSES
ncbi:MAG: HD domain-containing protein [Devosia sp.]|nr:HD domain-containing protein [Devosia sp.]